MDGNLGGIIGDTEIGLENFYRGYYAKVLHIREFLDKFGGDYCTPKQTKTPTIDFPGRVKSGTTDQNKTPTIDFLFKTKGEKSEELEQDSKINKISGPLKIDILPALTNQKNEQPDNMQPPKKMNIWNIEKVEDLTKEDLINILLLNKEIPKKVTVQGLDSYMHLFGKKVEKISILSDGFNQQVLEKLVALGKSFSIILDDKLEVFFDKTGFLRSKTPVSFEIECTEQEEIEDLSVLNYSFLKLWRDNGAKAKLTKTKGN